LKGFLKKMGGEEEGGEEEEGEEEEEVYEMEVEGEGGEVDEEPAGGAEGDPSSLPSSSSSSSTFVSGPSEDEHWLMCLAELPPSSSSFSSSSSSSSSSPTLLLLALNTQTGALLYDSFPDSSAQRNELDTRLRSLQPLELLLPSPIQKEGGKEGGKEGQSQQKEAGREGGVSSSLSLSGASEKCIAEYVREGGRKARVERMPAAEFEWAKAKEVVWKLFSRFQEEEGREEGGGVEVIDLDAEADEAKSSALPPSLPPSFPPACLSVLGPLLQHMQTFGMSRLLLSRPSLHPFLLPSLHMTLDGVTLRDLEIFSTPRGLPGGRGERGREGGKEEGSLFWFLNQTTTSFGARLLREWVRKPLMRKEEIEGRLDAVEELAFTLPPCLEEEGGVVGGVLRKGRRKGGRGGGREGGRGFPDLGAMVTALQYHKVTPKRLLLLLQTVEAVLLSFPPSLIADAEVQSSLLRALLRSLPQTSLLHDVRSFLSLLHLPATQQEDKPHMFSDPSFYPSLSRHLALLRDLEGQMDEELGRARKEMKKPGLAFRSLRTGVNSCVEYLIELPKREVGKVPGGWVLVSQTKEVCRYEIFSFIYFYLGIYLFVYLFCN
jgi:DNA mismatch repair protein MSH3